MAGKCFSSTERVMSRHFYITTPIYYPNGEPHLGHLYTTTCADVLARYHKRAGHATYFLTGTDEHGIKMVKTAAEEKVTPQQLADRNADIFRSATREFDISNDDFIRTTEARHKDRVQKIYDQLRASGDVYLGSYEGWYDEGQEEFVTETDAKAAEYKGKVSGKPLTRYSEKSYFFRLSKYTRKIYELIESDALQIRPQTRRNEVLSKLKEFDQDFSISRSTLSWGIPLTDDPSHVLYVWVDALSNYITALGYGSDDDKLYKSFWPADVHLMAKEILWFHAVYWPAMLLSIGAPLPKCIFAHGWWTSAGQKMSKSLGNAIDIDKLRALKASHSGDAIRFYMLRAAPFGNDLDWNDQEFNNAFNELGNVLGNLLNRVLKMTGNYRGGALPAIGASGPEDAALVAQLDAFPAELEQAYESLALQKCVQLPIELARAANVYIDQTKPFSLAKDPAQSARLDTVLSLSLRAAYAALVGLLPVLIEKAPAGLKQLGVDITGKTISELLKQSLSPGHKVGEGSPLFPKVEAKK
jgi:methionyl-tRNA synthetase